MLNHKTKWISSILVACLILFTISAITTAEDYTYPKKTKYDGEKINVAMVSEGICEELIPLLPEFEEKTGIKVNLELYPYPNLQEKMMIALTQKSGAYDVVHIDCVRYGQFAGQGWVIPLDDYISKTDPTILALDDHLPGLMQEQAIYDGKTFGMPYISAAMGLIYRKDLFDEYGVKLPNTWDELIEVCKAIQLKLPQGSYPLIFTAARDESLICTYMNLLGSYSGYVYDGNYVATMNTEAGKKSMEMLKELLGYCPPGATTYVHGEVLQMFGDGKIAAGVYWYNQAAIFEDPEKSKIVGKWDAYLMPGVKQADGS
ncbi:MAG: extracellular solute-binding protein, partial [Candidatus Atribacteria bacterium]|nr:extracellular solute-binding protein [Candidatus Atribacteria bacterium]